MTEKRNFPAPLPLHPPKGSGNRGTRRQSSVRSDTSEFIDSICEINDRNFSNTLDSIVRDWSRTRMKEAVEEGVV